MSCRQIRSEMMEMETEVEMPRQPYLSHGTEDGGGSCNAVVLSRSAKGSKPIGDGVGARL